MQRSPALLLITAAVFSMAAAMGVAQVAQNVAVAREAPSPQGTAPTELTLGAPTEDVAPRVTTPRRDREVLAAPAAPSADTFEARQLRGTGLLLAANGTSQDPVDRGGRTVQFSVEVEEATELDPDTVAAVVEDALYDERSWARDLDLRRVAPEDASIHVIVATPDSVDAMCRRAGLDTNGWLSCWSGSAAAINIDRWTDGIAHFDDLDQYRRYVVNHEVGHGLGYGHRDCPGRGRVAPLMQQQTKSLQGCLANEWRHTDG